ncbi:MAG: hypothetical protein K2X71_21680 [Methylobacterium sp.]|uniref:DUF7002 family protein n=1 Tax=Methylobacterium sp. TaxID=409 RepID=UPI00258D3DB8|nr:hypothetical protein [Methylobacterium sp.]MBY0298615.1 hypothetical protein [Methylobacterium sp.]
MTEQDLIETCPRLWHMAEAGSWDAIRTNGLLSTRALLDLYGVAGETRDAILSRRRPHAVTLRRAGLPDAVVRDQKPMSDAGLRACLDDGLTPAGWYEILNEKVFFWPSRTRLRRLLTARAYRATPHTVLTLRTASLVAAHRDRILLSPINSGATIMRPPRRGHATFRTVADFPIEERRRRAADAVAEVVVRGGVPDVADHVLAVHRCHGGEAEPLWRAPEAGPDDGP